MTPPPRRPRAAAHAAIRSTVALVGVCVVIVVAWAGCTVTQENYKLLSFFFDGVPDPSLPPGAVGSRPGQPGAPVFVVVHQPYADEKCDACHKTRYRPSKNDSTICLQCHEGVQTEYPFMHGPVASASCLWCHSPHESSRKALLRDDPRKLCLQCHVPGALSTGVGAHTDPSRDCLACHSGHGGAGRYMLKAAASEVGPPPETPTEAPERK